MLHDNMQLNYVCAYTSGDMSGHCLRSQGVHMQPITEWPLLQNRGQPLVRLGPVSLFVDTSIPNSGPFNGSAASAGKLGKKCSCKLTFPLMIELRQSVFSIVCKKQVVYMKPVVVGGADPTDCSSWIHSKGVAPVSLFLTPPTLKELILV